jgi:DNA/RNA endonuclease G (NUC1)
MSDELQIGEIAVTHNSSKITKLRYCVVICTLLLLFFLLSGLCLYIKNILTNNKNDSKTFMNCKIIQRNIVRPYPNQENFTYYISFNETIMQADFVKYIQPDITNSCSSCSYFRKDPYNINVLRQEDYTNTGFDRGHLVPNADYGEDTYIISNVVPMLPKFNKGDWKKSEQLIRDKYPDKLIYKGCDYSNEYIITSRNNKLYIPIGCSYFVFGTPSRSSGTYNIDKLTELQLLDYGYLENNEAETPIIKKLPYWIECS